MFKYSQFATSGNKLHKPQRGEVMENNDPKKIGRLKIKVPGLIEGSTENLPWCYAKNPSAFGGNKKSAAIHIPRIGSFLEITFPYANPYHCFYGSYWHSENSSDMSAFTENYPNRYGFQDQTGKQFIVDMKTHDLYYNHTSTDDNASPNDADTSGEESGGTSKFSAPRRLGDSSPHKLTLNLNKDGSINMSSLKDMILQMAGNTSMATSGSTSVSSQNGAVNIISQLSDIVHSAGNDILHNATSNIIHKAAKIFLN